MVLTRPVAMVVAAVLLKMGGGCMMPQDARRIAGYTEPAMEMEAPGGWRVRAATNLGGKAHYEIDPATGKLVFDLDMTSNAGDVTKAQGDRAAELIEMRRIEMAGIIAERQLNLEAMKSMMQMVMSFVPRAGNTAVVPPPLTPPPPSP